MKSYTFYLLRHGVSEANTQNRLVGVTDSPLSDEGRVQLEEIAGYLKPYPVNAVFCSPMSRAVETARILYQNSNPILLDGLGEYNFGQCEGVLADELTQNGALGFDEVLDGCSLTEGADNYEKFCETAVATFSKIIESCMKSGITEAAIISHGITIASVMHRIAYPKRDSLEKWLCPNGCGYMVKTDAALWMRDHIVEAMATTPKPKSLAKQRQ